METHVYSSINIEEVEEKIGYKFKDSALLRQALTDHSYLEKDDEETQSYERLEYMGDSVLNLLMAQHFYLKYPDLNPGMLTMLRAANVNTEKLARASISNGLHNYLLHRKPQLNGQIEEFTRAISDYELHSNGFIRLPKALADIVESIIGAVHTDSNLSLETSGKVAMTLLQPIITLQDLQMHPVVKLHEMCQKHKLEVKMNDDLWKKTGEIEVLVDGEVVGRANYPSKKTTAKNRAADDAYNQIMKIKFNMQDNTIDDGLSVSSLSMDEKNEDI